MIQMKHFEKKPYSWAIQRLLLLDKIIIQCPFVVKLAVRVLVLAPMTFMIMQQRTRTICNPTLIAIFSRLEKNRRANQIVRMRNSAISMDKGNSSDRGYNCEAKRSREHFWTVYDSRMHETFFRRVSKHGSMRRCRRKWLLEKTSLM